MVTHVVGNVNQKNKSTNGDETHHTNLIIIQESTVPEKGLSTVALEPDYDFNGQERLSFKESDFSLFNAKFKRFEAKLLEFESDLAANVTGEADLTVNNVRTEADLTANNVRAEADLTANNVRTEADLTANVRTEADLTANNVRAEADLTVNNVITEAEKSNSRTLICFYARLINQEIPGSSGFQELRGERSHPVNIGYLPQCASPPPLSAGVAFEPPSKFS